MHPGNIKKKSKTVNDKEMYPGNIKKKRKTVNDKEMYPGNIRKKRKTVNDKELNNCETEDNIYVLTSRNTSSKRIWDRHNFCVYCNMQYAKLPRHFERKHSSEIEVAQILSLPKKSAKRSMMWGLLKNKGNHAHNSEVLKSGKGFLIPGKRTIYKTTPTEYLPCCNCLAYYKRNEIWKHQKSCPALAVKGKVAKGGRIQGKCSLILSTEGPAISSEFQENILNKMNVDRISLLIRNDMLILNYGKRLFSKFTEYHQFQYCSQKMRELRRLVLELREVHANKNMYLNDAICPQNFNAVTESVRKLAGFDSLQNKYKIPSLAIKLGHSLKRCCSIKRAIALKSRDVATQEQCEAFENLCEIEWPDEVSNHAWSTLYKQKWNKPIMLPLEEDVVALNVFLKKKSKECSEKLEACKSDTDAWYTLAKVTLCQLILFNRKRSGEAERIGIEDWANVHSESSKDILKSLSKWEKCLCKKLKRLEIMGKRGRKVPILIPEAIFGSIQLLIVTRTNVDISKDNKFLFAVPAPSNRPIRSSVCIHKFALECGVNKPQNLTATRLRKHIATFSQVFNLQNNELDILATFMGHDINVHRNYYRLPEETTQVVKVGRILLALEKGKTFDFKNKKLDEIEISSEFEARRSTLQSLQS
ncbi:uncharacterized protein LOC117110386 [Anneissia japonica]|uniref:uncharacterized protein LOC117110386 n=1 Tax=Anneissia japonica TaxID=1529436 RepID=UPI001425B772|nr:uncharacterized protein LOC117110386 [Anneissia japonica]